MKIAVLSDTHMKGLSPWFRNVYAQHIAPNDVIIHCGDITRRPVWEFFLEQNHPHTYAVAGNMDEPALADELPQMLRLDLDGLKVGVAHGWGDDDEGLARTVVEAFGPGLDLICFGHTHVWEWTEHAGVKALNPGSLRFNYDLPLTMAVAHWEPGRELTAERVLVSPQWW